MLNLVELNKFRYALYMKDQSMRQKIYIRLVSSFVKSSLSPHFEKITENYTTELYMC